MRKLVSIFLGLALAACASGTPPPAISYDETDFQPAVVEAPLRPVEIVRVPEPLPLPGQLKPLPVESPDKGEELIFPEERVEAGNAAARVEPYSISASAMASSWFRSSSGLSRIRVSTASVKLEPDAITSATRSSV